MGNDFQKEFEEITKITFLINLLIGLNTKDSFGPNPQEKINNKLLIKKPARMNLNKVDNSDDGYSDENYCAKNVDEEAWDCLQDRILRVLTYKCNDCNYYKLDPRLESLNSQTTHNYADDEEDDIEAYYLQDFSEYFPVQIEIIPTVLPRVEYAQVVNITRDNAFIRIFRILRNIFTLKQCRNK